MIYIARFCFSDLHGIYDLWNQIKEYLKSDDIAYFLGDAIDRGPDGRRIMEEILSDNRITYIKGNHEDMFSIYALEFIQGKYLNYDIYEYNGGDITWRSFEDYPKEEIINLCNKLKQLPTYVQIENDEGKILHLSHAGTEPWVELAYKEGRITKKSIEDKRIWDRHHIFNDWSFFDNEYENHIILHGHSPVYAFEQIAKCSKGTEEDPEISFYADGHKIDLDLCSFISGKVALFNLDTFEVIYFKTRMNKYERY